jgi:hypothetical protein
VGWKFWVILVAAVMILSSVAFLVIRSSMKSSPSAQTSPSLDNFYGTSR